MVKIRLGAFQQGLPLPFWFKAQVKKAIGITIRVIKKKTRTVKAEDFANVINWWYKDEQKLWRKQQIKRRYKSKKLKAKAKRSRDDVWKLRAHKAEWLKLRAQIKKQKKRYFNALCDYREFIINPVPEKKYFDVDHPYKNFQKDEKERTEGWYVEKVCELLDLDLEEYWGYRYGLAYCERKAFKLKIRGLLRKQKRLKFSPRHYSVTTKTTPLLLTSYRQVYRNKYLLSRFYRA